MPRHVTTSQRRWFYLVVTVVFVALAAVEGRWRRRRPDGENDERPEPRRRQVKGPVDP